MKQHPMIADNFPSKAFLLITHLTETDPGVCSFSQDGNSFEIYDLSIFAQRFLPQYFKHSNYGSFVRQLNLYGFSSSRLKENNDIVVWSHELFHRDRKDLIREIKRTKKTKSTSIATSSHVERKDLIREIKRTKKTKSTSIAAPSHVCVNPRSPSPPPLLSDASSSGEVNRKVSGGKGIGALDRVWLESEFAHLKRQNKSLEEKLDNLLKVTARISLAARGPAPACDEEGEQVAGAKRRRMRPPEERDQMSPVDGNRANDSHNRYALAIEEQKLSDGDNYGFHPTSYDEDDRKPPASVDCAAMSGSANEYELGSGDRNDSLKRFVDIMLSEDDQDEDSAGNGRWMNMYEEGDWKNEPESKYDESEYNRAADASAAPVAHRFHIGNNAPKSPPTDVVENILDDELMEEARLAMVPGATIDTDGDLFAQIEDDKESVVIPDDDACDGSMARSRASPGHSTKVSLTTNADRGKSDGPSPVLTISADVPDVHSADIEEGELPVGVAVIAAEAELVEGGNNGNVESPHDRGQEDHDQRHRRRVIFLLAFIGAALVVGATWPAVALTRNKKRTGKKLKERGASSSFRGKPGKFHPPPCPPGSRKPGGRCHNKGSEDHPPDWKQGRQDDEYGDKGSEGHDNGVDPAFDTGINGSDQPQGSDVPNTTLNATQVWRHASRHRRRRRHFHGDRDENANPSSDDLRDDESSAVLDSFTVVLGGNGYACSLGVFS